MHGDACGVKSMCRTGYSEQGTQLYPEASAWNTVFRTSPMFDINKSGYK